MHTLKTMILALMLIIFSIAGLRAEEISLKQFRQEVFTALQTDDFQKFQTLTIDNPDTTKKFQQMLAIM